MKKLALLAITLSFVNTAVASDAHYQEMTASGGTVNWSTGRVSADGYGVAPATSNTKAGPLLACRAAVVDAQRNLLEVTQGVRVNATTLINNYMLKSDEVKSSVEGVVRNARLVSREPDNTGGCKVTLEFSIQGDTSRAVYRELANSSNSVSWLKNGFNKLLGDVFPTAHAATISVDDPLSEKINEISKRLSLLESKVDATKLEQATFKPGVDSLDVLPTGLVVDARGSNFIPSLSPKIRRLRGSVVYPRLNESEKTKLIDNGALVSLFAKDVEFAINHPSVGARPLLVKALRTYGDTRTEIVLSSDYADRLLALSEQHFFDDAGVIIVLD